MTKPTLRDPRQMLRASEANLYRFYVRAVQPTMVQFALSMLEYGAFEDLDRFLSTVSLQVGNYAGIEAAKVFALITSGLFERQLHMSGLAMFGEDSGVTSARRRSARSW